MLTAFVLVCSRALTPDLRECGRDNAVQVLQVPEEFALPAMCAMRGQAFLAETSVGQELANDERVKVTCTRTAASPGTIVRPSAQDRNKHGNPSKAHLNAPALD